MESVTLYQFDNFDMDTYIIMYLSKTSARGTKSRIVIEGKVIYLQDLIIRKSMSNKDTDDFRLHSQILKNIIGDEYSAMLSTLIEMKYLKESVCDYKYIKGKQSKCFSIVEDKYKHIVSTTTSNIKIKEYLEKEEEQLFQFRNKYVIPEVDGRYGKDFRVTYEKSLCKIKIEKPDEFERYIPIAIQLQKEKKEEKKKEKKETKVQTNDRTLLQLCKKRTCF